jgi:glycosyltransferase involved in cell wall biosynthesis
MEKVNVLEIITRLDAGGSAISVMELAARLDNSRYETFLVAGKTNDPDGGIRRFLDEKGVAHTFVDDLVRPLALWSDIRAFWKLYRMIRKRRYDIVHTHTSKAGILGRWAAWMAGVPRIIHTTHGHIFHGYFGKLPISFFILAERVTALITDKIVVLTRMERDDHFRLKIAPPDRFAVIPAGIDLSVFSIDPESGRRLRRELGVPEGDVVFGSVARLDPIKGSRFLIDAMPQVVEKYPGTTLVLVGDGSEREGLMKQCRALGIQDHVIFAGYQEDVLKYLNLMDVFVLASINEGMGMALVEAMACAKAIIATRTGGIPEIIEDGHNGILVPPGDADALGRAMMELLAHPDTRSRLQENTKKFDLQRFSIDKMVSDTDRLYTSLLARKRGQ